MLGATLEATLLQMGTSCIPEDLIWRPLVEAQMAREQWAVMVFSQGGLAVQG